MSYTFCCMDEASARAILSWRYEPPYDFYNIAPSQIEVAVRALLDPANAYQAITDLQGQLVAFCCFGADARVPGGDYRAEALDVGLGMRPDLTGRGRGLELVNAILAWAGEQLAPCALRLTVTAFNVRALRVYQQAGFQPAQRFRREGDGGEFVVLMKEP